MLSEKMKSSEESNDPIYYRIHFDGEDVAIIELQWFNEYDYDKAFWISSFPFPTEQQAIDYLKCKYFEKQQDLPENLQQAIKAFVENPANKTMTNILD